MCIQFFMCSSLVQSKITNIRKFPKGKMISIDDGWIDIFIPAWSIGSRSLPWIINQMISAASIREQNTSSESNTYNRTCDHDFWCALPSHLNIAIIIIISSPISFIICYSSLSQIFWCQHHATEMDFSPGTHQLLTKPFSDVLKMRYWLRDI